MNRACASAASAASLTLEPGSTTLTSAGVSSARVQLRVITNVLDFGGKRLSV
ncbi:hypothetical protein PF005_g23018 [Phytophthora fragariae]|uniref:Uncharacterized protein n=1 Tax=Phytophthora fragariae TaxID=53985 RepID=A0A6A4C7G7_9STRA|nr:hypothetical protein PF003_g14642 [Phytophthora fragariae]KAE8926139.1 hypothetical protein PF009_g23666 [Phytophthora fragariae]KAE8980156.1 hypothetical protein PF011_g22557 [Phytophthora fragariae]KAE9078429.1 hypothetical protein PF007_g23866 [Phytophthora fragariae]KAE9080652.1 hypothetical protein PF010_g22298 [Phytophthora fragariae]